MNKNICFIIPAYNEEKNIANVIIKCKKIGHVIVINDASTDSTKNISKKLGSIVINNKENQGYDTSIHLGLKLACKSGYNYAITIDADGQHLIKDAKKIYKYLKKGFIISAGIRGKKQRIMENIFELYTSFFFGLYDPLCGLKGYNLKITKKYGLLNKKNYIGTSALLNAKKKGAKVFQVKISQKQRLGMSKFGGDFYGNFKIFRSFCLIVIRDIFNLFNMKKNDNLKNNNYNEFK